MSSSATLSPRHPVTTVTKTRLYSHRDKPMVSALVQIKRVNASETKGAITKTLKHGSAGKFRILWDGQSLYGIKELHTDFAVSKTRRTSKADIYSEAQNLGAEVWAVESPQTAAQKSKFYIPMPLYAGSCRDTFALNLPSEARAALTRGVLRDILPLVQELHSRNQGHFDLKPCNFLISKDGELALGDRGFQELLPPSGARGFRGSIGFAAPELISPPSVRSLNCDSWSLGISLLGTLAGGPNPLSEKLELSDACTRWARSKELTEALVVWLNGLIIDTPLGGRQSNLIAQPGRPNYPNTKEGLAWESFLTRARDCDPAVVDMVLTCLVVPSPEMRSLDDALALREMLEPDPRLLKEIGQALWTRKLPIIAQLRSAVA